MKNVFHDLLQNSLFQDYEYEMFDVNEENDIQNLRN